MIYRRFLIHKILFFAYQFVFVTSFVMALSFPSQLCAQVTEEMKFDVDCSVPPSIKRTRPDPAGRPTKIDIGFYVIDVKQINDAEQSFSADFLFDVTWSDPRLSKKSLDRSLDLCDIELSDVWFPEVIAINIITGKELLDLVVHVDDEGDITYVQRFVGEFSSDFDFKEFPFDRQKLQFIIASVDYGPEEVQFEVSKTGMRDKLSVEGWTIKLLKPVITEEYIKSDDRNLARIDFLLLAKRDKNYYVWKIIAPLCLIAFMAWTVFWIDPSQIGPQIGLSTGTIFTLIAYRFAIGFQLPRVSYFTKMDKFVLLSTILVFLTLGTAVATSKIALDGRKDLAQRIDKYGRVVYLLIFILILLFSFGDF